MKKFEETWFVTDLLSPTHHRNARTIGNIGAILIGSNEEDPNLAITRRAHHLDLTYGTFRRILYFHLYNVQVTEDLKSVDPAMRRRYAYCLFEQQRLDEDFCDRICFNDDGVVPRYTT